MKLTLLTLISSPITLDLLMISTKFSAFSMSVNLMITLISSGSMITSIISKLSFVYCLIISFICSSLKSFVPKTISTWFDVGSTALDDGEESTLFDDDEKDSALNNEDEDDV